MSGENRDNSDDICDALGPDEPARPRPVHSDRLCRRLTAHRTAAVQVELSRNPNVALAVLMNRLIPCVFRERYLGAYDAHAVGIQATSSRDRLLNEADDMEASPAWAELSAEHRKWEAILPDGFAGLLPWLCEQGEDIISNLFAFCVAATVDGVSGTDRVHPVNVIYDLLDFDMAKYWKPTRASYLSHVSKARIGEVVANAISGEAAAPLATMKKEAAAEAAELRLAGTGWVPSIMTNREKPRVCCAANDAEEENDDAA